MQPLQFAIGVLIGTAVIGSVSTLPGMLVSSNEALEEVNRVWRNKKIQWTEIREIDTEERGTAVTVVCSGYRKIIYTNVYPDRPRFLLEIKRPCGENLPPNFPNENLSSDGAI